MVKEILLKEGKFQVTYFDVYGEIRVEHIVRGEIVGSYNFNSGSVEIRAKSLLDADKIFRLINKGVTKRLKEAKKEYEKTGSHRI